MQPDRTTCRRRLPVQNLGLTSRRHWVALCHPVSPLATEVQADREHATDLLGGRRVRFTVGDSGFLSNGCPAEAITVKESRTRMMVGMNRLGIVLGVVAAAVAWLVIGLGTDPMPAILPWMLGSLGFGVFVWLIILGLGWAIAGFRTRTDRPDQRPPTYPHRGS